MISYTEPLFVLLLMVFMHIFEDFFLQGIMANMKQSDWWKKNVPERFKYLVRYDHIPVLILHGFEWAFCICVPLMLIMDDVIIWALMIFINTIIHAIVDHVKCNMLKINLCIDQSIHLAQIVITFLIGMII